MRHFVLAVAVVALAGCGADTMSTAGTAAVLKKQELEQGRKSMEQAQQKIGQAVELMEQRARKAGDAAN
jgi:hypothetical protein